MPTLGRQKRLESREGRRGIKREDGGRGVDRVEDQGADGLDQDQGQGHEADRHILKEGNSRMKIRRQIVIILGSAKLVEAHHGATRNPQRLPTTL